MLKHTKKGALQKIIRNTPSSISPYVKIKLLVILNIGISGTVITVSYTHLDVYKRQGYGLRGSDARTEIEHTKEADTPGEIPGRSGLQADRRTGNKFIMRGVWLRSKEMEEIIMTLSMKEKKILYAYGCPSHHNTVTRLKWLTALTVDPEAKRRMLGLARKVETEMNESWYEDFYHHLRMEMDEYRRLKRNLRVLKSYTDYEEDLYEEAV